MIEAHVVTSDNRHLYEDEWEQFLKLRHVHFVEEKGWREPSEDGRETDQFDTDAASYILGIEEGAVVGSARLIRTSEPNMVSDVFSHFCDVRAVPNREDWADWTRSFIARGKRSYGLRGTAGQMAAAVMEYCLAEGIRYVGGIQPLYFLPRWQDIGWDAKCMGSPQMAGDDWCVVAYLKVGKEALASARAHCGIDHDLLVRRGVPRTVPNPLRRRPAVPPLVERVAQ